jgi:hypothetical protein
MALTSPLKNVGFIIFLFLNLAIFLISFGHLLAHLKSPYVGLRTKYKIYILSILVVVALMFRSAASLNVSDLIILILITFGLVFYSSKRTS